MKTQTFGVSSHAHVTYSSENDPNRIRCKIQALDAYRQARENGDPCDNPARPFPGDGNYEWVHPNYGKEQYTLIRYSQGPADKAWMEEKDRRYISRLEAERRQQQELENQRQAIQAAQAETARQQAIARQAEIDRLAALKAQQKAEKKAEEARLAKEQEKQERLHDNLEKGQQVIASQKKVLTQELSSLRNTVSFLRKMDKRQVIPEASLHEMEQELLTAENKLTLKK